MWIYGYGFKFVVNIIHTHSVTLYTTQNSVLVTVREGLRPTEKTHSNAVNSINGPTLAQCLAEVFFGILIVE